MTPDEATRALAFGREVLAFAAAMEHDPLIRAQERERDLSTIAEIEAAWAQAPWREYGPLGVKVAGRMPQDIATLLEIAKRHIKHE
jgi:hypothetical protein